MSMNSILQSFFDSTSNRTLLLGPPKCGKTSLIFRLAYEEANKGGTPYILTKKEKLYANLPHNISLILTENSQENNTNNNMVSLNYLPEILSKINIKYLETLQDIMQFFIAIQSLTPRPTLIIFDDFSNYFQSTLHDILTEPTVILNNESKKFNPNILKDIFLIISLINDSIKFLDNYNKSSPSNIISQSVSSPQYSPVKLIITENKVEDSSLQALLMKFFDNLAIISQMPLSNKSFFSAADSTFHSASTSINLLPYSLRISYHPENTINPPTIIATRIELIDNELVYFSEK